MEARKAMGRPTILFVLIASAARTFLTTPGATTVRCPFPRLRTSMGNGRVGSGGAVQGTAECLRERARAPQEHHQEILAGKIPGAPHRDAAVGGAGWMGVS
eukprot:1128104-Pyramimonas_sp.AAC.1